MWFLWSVFFNIIIVCLVRRMGDSFLFYSIIWIGLLFVPPFLLDGVYSFMYPFFVIGYLSNKYGIIQRCRNYISIYSFVSFLLFLLCLYFFERESYVYVSGQSINREFGLFYLIVDIYRLITGLLGSVSIMYICFIIYTKNTLDRFIKVITSFGKMSMGIYCFQCLFFSYWETMIIGCVPFFSVFSTLVTFFLAGSFSIFLTWMSMKSRVAKILLLGGR
jgi:hypothetical protein